jgi:hypothetical protein
LTDFANIPGEQRKSKSVGHLGFALKYTKTATSTEGREFGTTENMLTRLANL